MTTIQQKIRKTVLSSRNVLVTSHQNPDGDSLGSQLALTAFLRGRGVSCAIINEGPIPQKYRFLPGISDVLDIDGRPALPQSFDVAVVIECSDLARVGNVRRLIDTQCLIVNIDHHPDNRDFGGLNWNDTTASAAGEMIYDFIREGGQAITPDMATNLFTAILTDTGRFQYSNTTARCLRVAAELLEAGADPTQITNEIYYQNSREAIRLAALLASDMQYLVDHRLCVMTLPRRLLEEMPDGLRDTEGLVNQTMNAAGVQIGVLFTEIDQHHTKVSFRSRKAIDVGRTAARYGGGGHVNASGCTIDLSLDKAKEVILAHLKEQLNGSV